MPLFQNESVQNLSYENEFDLHENEPLGGTHFDMNGFALKLRQTRTVTKANIIMMVVAGRYDQVIELMS